MNQPKDRSFILTEKKNPKSAKIDTMTTTEILKLINDEDATVHEAVRDALPEIAQAVDFVYDAFKNGGRLRYAGAGTSGRLGVLDASECPPTFSVDPDLVQGIIAGGRIALENAVEGAEDYAEKGKEDCMEFGLKSGDVLMGIATGGTTPYVHGAIDYANSIGCKTIFFTCTHKEELGSNADVIIEALVGPEIITGSTRLKAGTATKMVLNMITTSAMIKWGKVFGNYMVDHMAINEKLVDRATRIISELAEIDREKAYEYLLKGNKNLKESIVMAKLDVSLEESRKLINKHDGFIRFAVDK